MGAALVQFERLRKAMVTLEAQTKAADRASASFGTRAGAAFAHLEAAGKRLTQTGRVLSFTFTTPLVLGFALVERAALGVSEKTALLAQVYTASNGEAAKFGNTSKFVSDELAKQSKVAFALSNGYGVAVNSVYDLMIAFGRAGLSGVQMSQATENAIILMRAFQVPTQVAVDTIMQIGVAYRLSGQQTLQATAILGYAAQQTRADLSTLAAGFIKAAPAAQQLGIDVQHLAAILAVMQQAGFKGAESGTALNFALVRLLSPTPTASKMLKQLGVDTHSVAWNTATATQNLDTLTGVFGKMTDRQRALAIATIFGARQNSKLQAFFTDVLNPLGMYHKLLKATGDATGNLAWLQNQLVLSMANDKTRFEILKTQVLNSAMAIANYLTPALLAVMGLIQQAAAWFAKLGDTAGGRSTQSIIVFSLVLLAALGPLAMIVGSVMTLWGAMGRFMVWVADVAVPMLGALGTAIMGATWEFWAIAAALVGVALLAWKFRDAFVGALVALYNDVLTIAKNIYAALQWINPFAHHSPSLVERTRDGVALMVGYWKQLSPVLTIMDTASVAARNFAKAMLAVASAHDAANNAKDRATLVKSGGAAAGTAYDAIIAANSKLSASLPGIAALYDKQSVKVNAASKALDDATVSVDAASAALQKLQDMQTALQAQRDAIGDPAALHSQAKAASDMSRALIDAGNSPLAGQFGAQADALNAQADAAQAVQTQIDSMTVQIDAQTAAVKLLQDAKDGLQKTYDTENGRLQLLKDGYDAVTKAIQDNVQAIQDMVSASAGVTRSKSGKVSAASANAMAGFAGGGGNVAVTGAKALPKMGGTKGQTLDQYIADLNKRMATQMAELFPNPLDAIKKWWDKFAGPFKWLGDQFGKVNLAGSGSHNILHAIFGDDIEASVKNVFDGIGTALTTGFGGLGGVANGALGNVGKIIGDVVGGALDVVQMAGAAIGRVLSIIGKFFKDNGPAIGKIIKTLVSAFLLVLGAAYKVYDFLWKKLWPIVKNQLAGAFKVIGDVFQVIADAVSVVIQLLSGNFSQAWAKFKALLLAGRALLTDLFQVMIGNLIAMLPGLLAGIGTLVGQFFSNLPGWLWTAFKGGWAAAFHLVEFIAGWLIENGPAIATAVGDFFKKLPGWAWTAIKFVFSSEWNIMKAIGGWLIENEPKIMLATAKFFAKLPGWAWNAAEAVFNGAWKLLEAVQAWLVVNQPKINKALGDFAKKIPGWIWDGIKASWNSMMDLVGMVGTWLVETSPKVATKVEQFGKDIIAGIVNGIKNAPADLAGALTDSISSAFDKAKSFLHINSPSKLAAKVLGAPISEGVAYGITGNAQTVTNALLSTLSDAHRAASLASQTLVLPSLTQLVTLQYTNQPINGLAPTTVGAPGSGGSATGGTTGGATTHIEQTFNLSKAESQDPHTLAAVMSWALRGSL